MIMIIYDDNEVMSMVMMMDDNDADDAVDFPLIVDLVNTDLFLRRTFLLIGYHIKKMIFTCPQ